MNIGIIGAGAIAQFLMEEIQKDTETDLSVQSLLVRDTNKYATLRETFGIDLFDEVDAFLDSDIDIVVEAANIEAVKSLVPHTLEKKDVVVISIGALADKTFSETVYSTAETFHRSVYLPSGAIGGIDLIQNASSLGEVEKVSLTTRKPAHSLGEPGITEEKVIFHGPASDAIEKFPKNINVSIILSLAGKGIRETEVTIIADPNADKNEHAIKAIGDFGTFTATIENNPLPSNPKTSYLAALSILGTLKKVKSPLRIGT
ncbi:aspartate dehydrogenase [Alteribacillus iranensis]|uniref:L-aspartate dehydrogenase n=1 Tax=Alteribacillus iranensis TaxID=930128 RepID=A0A1I2F0U1_9BACI|nr:aspartate dehydrogenase [Alteribacillus iranensis]SFE98972.1 aspartate dehydrogenase [Alteribacillus iranensis]